jgi:hypothetical protein
MKCADCKYWGAERAQVVDMPLGTCRRRAPGLTRPQELQNRDGRKLEVPRAEWPWTAFDDWCGEFHVKHEPVF